MEGFTEVIFEQRLEGNERSERCWDTGRSDLALPARDKSAAGTLG
jgi:hypothetical protein